MVFEFWEQFLHAFRFICWIAMFWNNVSFCSNQGGVEGFRLFLQKEYSEENLEFWIDCEKYKKCGGCRVRKYSAAVKSPGDQFEQGKATSSSTSNLATTNNSQCTSTNHCCPNCVLKAKSLIERYISQSAPREVCFLQ